MLHLDYSISRPRNEVMVSFHVMSTGILGDEFLLQLVAWGGMNHVVLVESVHNPVPSISLQEDGPLAIHSSIPLLLNLVRDAEVPLSRRLPGSIHASRSACPSAGGTIPGYQ